MRVNGLQSRSIDVMRFAMILLVVVLHAYTSTRSDFSAGDFPGYRLVSVVCSLEIAQTAVPAQMCIRDSCNTPLDDTQPGKLG